MSLRWPGTALGSPLVELEDISVEKENCLEKEVCLGISAQSEAPATSAEGKKMDSILITVTSSSGTPEI